MGETNNNTQGPKPKFCRISIWVLFLGFWVFCVLAIVSISFIPSLYLLQHCVFVLRLSAIAGFVLGILSLIETRRRGHFKYKLVIFVLIPIAALMIILASALQSGIDTFFSINCSSNLSSLGKSFYLYTKDNKEYPPANKWCDCLIEGGYAVDTQFKCPANNKQRCGYAINPNCKHNSNKNVVLLFETRGGWNQFGGPKMLTTKHYKGKGCNILFNSGHVEFVKKKLLGDLNWGDEQKQ